MVTARFLVGTNADDAILRVHEKIRANIDRIPVGIPEPLIVGRGINDVAIVVLTLSPKPDAAARWTDKDLYQLADELQAELDKVDNVGLTYIAGGNPQQIRVEPDPEKLALYGVTLQQLVAKVAAPTAPSSPAACATTARMRDVAAGQTLIGMPDIGLLAGDHARRPAGLCPRRRQGGDRRRARRNTGSGSMRAEERRPALAARAGGQPSPSPSAPAPMPWWSPRHRWRASRALEGRLIPADVEVTVTRDYGETANDKANELLFHLGLATVSIVVLIALRHRLARGGGHAGRHPHHHPAHAVRRQSDGLHHQPGQPVRADLLHRHPGRRRHRGGREHRPPLGDERRPRRACRRAIEAVAEVGNPDHRRHPDRGGGAAADAVRLRPDGPLHGADPGQCLGGDAVLLLRRHGDRALADAEAASGKARRVHGTRPQHGEGRLGRALSPLSPRRSCATRKRAWIFLLGVGVATVAGLRAVRHQERDGEAAALRQQVGTGGGGRPARRRHLEDTERALFAAAAIGAAAAGGALDPGLCRHRRRRSTSTAWCGTIICAQPPELGELQVNLRRQVRAQPRQPRDRARSARSG